MSERRDASSITGSRNRLPERAFVAVCGAAVLLPLIILALLFGDVLWQSLPRLSWAFLTSFPSGDAASAGVYPAVVSSLYLVGLTALIAVPIGVGAAVYLEE